MTPFDDHRLHSIIHELRSAMDYKEPPFSLSALIDKLFPEIDVVARKMDLHATIEVYDKPLPRGIRAVIAYNEDAHASTQRFSIAHELCHWLVDFERGDRLTVASSCARRNGRRPPEERRADYFAAELLAPLWILDRFVDFDIHPVDDDEDAIAKRDQRIQRLASRFNLSMKCMRNRVMSLYHWRKIVR